MAQHVHVSFVDDLDGGEAEGTVSFALDGRTYEIDLSARNLARLREILAPFVAAGRRAGGVARAPRRSARAEMPAAGVPARPGPVERPRRLPTVLEPTFSSAPG